MQYKCETCWCSIKEFDPILILDEKVYHKDCVELYPTNYVVYSDDEFIGTVEDDDIQYAYELLEDLEEEEEDV